MSNPVITKEHFKQANCQMMRDIKEDIEKDKAMSEELPQTPPPQHNLNIDNERVLPPRSLTKNALHASRPDPSSPRSATL